MIIRLNLARNCLKYLIRAYGIKEIFIPYYSCETIRKAIREENCKIKFYHIDKNFMPLENFNKKDFILYINYFGIFEKNCQIISQKYPNVIIDNTHGFYCQNYGLASFNSLRKFFKVQNGAYLYIAKVLDEKFNQDNLEICPYYFHENYEKFVENERKLNQENEIKIISKFVQNYMNKIDFEKDKNQRQELFSQYKNKFDKFNLITINEINDVYPYCYPFSTEDKNILNMLEKFTVLRIWKDIPKNFPEYKWLNNTVALPLNDVNYADKIIRQTL